MRPRIILRRLLASLQVTPEHCTLLHTVNFLGKTHICQLSQEGRQAGIAKQIYFFSQNPFSVLCHKDLGRFWCRENVKLKKNAMESVTGNCY
jgi:hypothetical protein